MKVYPVPMKHTRRSIRLQEYDYSQPGGYFVTVVTHHRACIFGEIISSKMHYFDLGRIAEECWESIPRHFTNVEIYPYVIMPNHIHGIITIHDDSSRGTIYRAPTEDTNVKDLQDLNELHTQGKRNENFGKPISGSLPTIIRTYKAAVSRRAKQELGFVNVWQRNYYEHILRGEADWKTIHKYMLVNPENWGNDPEYLAEI
jgi:putative transposase